MKLRMDFKWEMDNTRYLLSTLYLLAYVPDGMLYLFFKTFNLSLTCAGCCTHWKIFSITMSRIRIYWIFKKNFCLTIIIIQIFFYIFNLNFISSHPEHNEREFQFPRYIYTYMEKMDHIISGLKLRVNLGWIIFVH